MKTNVAEIAGAPPRGIILTRATGARLADSANAESRTITFIASDESVGRDGHRIFADAWQVQDFLKNPVFLFAHKDDEPPIGKVISLRTVGSQLRATVRFADAETYPLAQTIYAMYRDGYLNACSTAWLPIKWKAANDRNRPGGLDFTEVDLLEISGVPVPALPTALVTARSAGIDLAPLADWAERTLDSRQRLYSEKALVMIRQAASAGASRAVPARTSEERQITARALQDRHGRPRSDPASGFRSFGEFLQSVARASADDQQPDRRLVRAPTGASIENATGAGFLVPPTYLDELISSIYEESIILPRCANFETERPADCSIPGIDETSRADGSRWGGVVSYWQPEADAVSSSMPKWRSVLFSATKLYAVSVATSELLADAPMLGAYVRRAFSSELCFKLEAGVLSGPGAGRPLGILESPSLITVAKEQGQASGTITPGNVESMWSRLPSPSRRHAVWLVNEDAEEQFSKQLLTAGSGASLSASSAALYVAAGVAGNEFPLFKGRPLLAMEQAPQLGALGDIVLADLRYYGIVTSPMRTDISADVRFLTDESVFRFAWRVAGAPLWKSPITPYNGGATRSPFVALAAR